MKHTKGPWKVSKQCDTLIMAGQRSIASAGGYSSNVNGNNIHKENLANTRLIAAAPDMLKVLQKVMLLGENTESLSIGPVAALKELARNAKEAINKATK